MFIFIQIRSKHLKTIDLIDQSCSTCKNRGVLKIHFYQNYTWLFGPIAPVGKHATIECGVCKTTIPNKKWTKEFDAIFRKEKKLLKTPLKLWRGFFIVMLILLGTLYYVYHTVTTPNDYQKILNNKEVNLTNVKNYKVGDVLFIGIMIYPENSSGYPEYYTFAKVEKIEKDKTTLRKSSEKFNYFQQSDLKLSDVDDSKFYEEIIVKTDDLRKNGSLKLFDSPKGKSENQLFGNAETVIKE